MHCTACGHENRAAARFCEACGERFQTSCPNCGIELRAGARFCDECGTATGQAASPPTATLPTSREPRAYTPKHLADKILQSKSALEGERKQVSVMFADVKDSMGLAEQLGAERWHHTLDQFFQILANGVHRFEGTVNQYTGDGIMALFGAPIAHEDHAHRSSYAALSLRDELREFAREIKRECGVDFAVRIGIHSGEVIVGKIGDDLRMDYTAQGQTVGLAQRMESLASGGSIYLTEATAHLIRGYFELEDLGDFEVKGVGAPVRVFELQGLGKAHTRFDVSRSRGLSRFVGRSDESALLQVALEQGIAGPGRIVGVSAQAGTGKSRLCYEFLENVRSRGVTVYECRGLAHGRNLPLLPMLELLRSFFGIEERDSERVAREKVAGRVLLLDATLQDDLPIFWDLLGIPDPNRPLPTLEPSLLQRRMYAAVRKIVRADAELDPGVLLVEDLHWLDPASDAMLEHIVEATAESRSLLLVNFRPEYRARWMQQSYYQQLSLLPLSEVALKELLADLLGSHPSVAALPAAIYARTGGNPFYIEEVVQSLIEDGHLDGTRGNFQLVTPIAKLPIPQSVQALLAARIDRLLEREKRVLQIASVVGKTFAETTLAEVADLPEAELADCLRRLQDAEFVYESALYPEHEYSFKHPLTQEVAEQSQLDQRRRQAHAAVAKAYQTLHADRLDEWAARIAQHLEAAGQSTDAAHWHSRAAERINRSDYDQAMEHWRHVDALLPDRGGDEASQELRGRAYGELLVRGFRTGIDLAEAKAILERARSFFTARAEPGRFAGALMAYAGIVQSAGEQREYLALCEEGQSIAEAAGDRLQRVSFGLDWVYARTMAGNLSGALDAANETISLTGGDASLGVERTGYSPLAIVTAFSGMTLALLGRPREALVRVSEGRQLVGPYDSGETRAWLYFAEAEVELARGDLDAALRCARAARSESERSGSAFDAVATRSWLGIVHAERAEWREAEDLIAQARERSAGRIGCDTILNCGWAYAAAALGLGDLERARERVEQCIAEYRKQDARYLLARALLVRAETQRADPAASPDAFEADLAAAGQIAVEIGARRVLALTYEARGQLREAMALYEAIDAPGHVARVRSVIEAAS